MEPDINKLSIKLNELDKEGKFDEIISLLTDEELEKEDNKHNAAELYIWRGNSWYNKKEYDNAIMDYTRAIDINPNSELAFYNRGLAWCAKKEYIKAIDDNDKVLLINPNSASAYFIRASVRRVINEYEIAIEDYNRAIEIDPVYVDAYYSRGLAKVEKGIDLVGSKKDFEKYLELTIHKNDVWADYANYYIENLNERINDKKLSFIADLVSKIKDILRIDEDCITHYSSLSVLKSLIIDKSKFRISEGNFMNDPSEGTEFFNFLEYKFHTCSKGGSFLETFTPKPFIGSFVTKDKYDDLNMWRFYGKEEGVEAKGCAITLDMHKFIEDISSSLLTAEEDFLKYKSDINFYRVTYIAHEPTNFYIPTLDPMESEKLKKMIEELKDKVQNYNVKDKTQLEKYLNSIAFLFKSEAYKNENEVRLVVEGIEFKKKINMNVIPPRVYIELVSIEKIVEQITLGPKVDKVSEWASAFHYSYEENAPAIMISHLPYK